MKRDIDIIRVSPLQGLSDVMIKHDLEPKDDGTSTTDDTVDEHPYMQTIRNAVLKYRLQSAAHFDVNISVEQASQSLPIHEDWRTDPSFKIKVRFADFNGPEFYTCRPKFRTNKKNVQVPQHRVMIVGHGRTTAINSFLKTKFPAQDEVSVSDSTMQAWWDDNGKHFGWAGLSTELKELVLKNCLHRSVSRTQCKKAVRRHKSRRQHRVGEPREFGIFEIVHQLGDWASVLRVSHQVRAIALRLCFMGGSELVYNKGFCIFPKSLQGLHNTLSRLGRYYQLASAEGLPVDEETQTLADCYKYYPKIYRHLDQYAMFCHGIRRVCITMGFYDSMSFFRVTVGGFGQYTKASSLSYEVFDRLPHLAEIAIQLPGKPRKGWSNLFCRGPILFHHESPCPRTLHRLIYERIADCLALYPHLIVRGFIDDEEQARFDSLREAAMENPKWTPEEFDELYAECGGGVQLDEAVVPGSWLDRDEEDMELSSAGEEETASEDTTAMEEVTTEGEAAAEEQAAEEVAEDYFPPECHCEEKCLVVFNDRQQY